MCDECASYIKTVNSKMPRFSTSSTMKLSELHSAFNRPSFRLFFKENGLITKLAAIPQKTASLGKSNGSDYIT